MSLAEQLTRKRQSCQATKIRPAASISAEEIPRGARRPPATVWAMTLATGEVPLQDTPPLVELNARIALPLAEYGTTTVPFGWTSGCPASPDGAPDGATGVDQVRPPLAEVLSTIRLPDEEMSASM